MPEPPCAAIARGTSGRLPLSVNGGALEYVREFLQAFTAAHSEVDLDVTLKFEDESQEGLVRRTVDASILWSGDGPPPGYAATSSLIVAPGAGIAVRATHPLATHPEVALHRLDGQRLVMFPRERAPDLYDLILDGLGGASRFSSIHHITPIGQGVAADMLGALDNESVAPSPQWGALRSPQGFVYMPVIPALAASLWLVWTGVATGPTRALAAFANQATAQEPSLTLVQSL